MNDSGSSQAGEYQWRLSSQAKIADQYAHAIGVIVFAMQESLDKDARIEELEAQHKVDEEKMEQAFHDLGVLQRQLERSTEGKVLVDKEELAQVALLADNYSSILGSRLEGIICEALQENRGSPQ